MTQQYGVGKWRTRDGRKAIVDSTLDPRHTFPLRGWVDNRLTYWDENGNFCGYKSDSPLDLVAPWSEPTTQQEPVFISRLVAHQPIVDAPALSELQRKAEMFDELVGALPSILKRVDASILVHKEGREKYTAIKRILAEAQQVQASTTTKEQDSE